jgi:hypothetical protein
VYLYFGKPPNGGGLTKRIVKTSKAGACLRKQHVSDVAQVFLPVGEFRHQTTNIGFSPTK